MGVDLGDICERRELKWEELSGKVVAIDAYNALYQFLGIIRQRDGSPLVDSHGNITSHLSGLLYRTTNFIENGIKPIYVFDGPPPEFKGKTVEARIKVRDEAKALWEQAAAAGSDEAFKYAQASSRVRKDMVEDAKELLGYMGVPCVQAPSEGEAQAAFMVQKGDAYAAGSQDYDALLFGAPVVVRNLAITGTRKLPGKNIYVDVAPELIELQNVLSKHGISREQLVDIALLTGTDYNPGIKGIGPKKAFKLITKHGSIDAGLNELGTDIPHLHEIRDFFLHPPVSSDYSLKWGKPDVPAVIKFLCAGHDFSEARVSKAMERLLDAAPGGQQTLDKWFG